MSSTRLISKNLSRAPLAFFNLMTIFRPFFLNDFLLDFNVGWPLFGHQSKEVIDYRVLSVKTKFEGVWTKFKRRKEK